MLMTPFPTLGRQSGTPVAPPGTGAETETGRGGRENPTPECIVEVIANPAITDGAMRVLMSGRAPDPIESIMVFALQLRNSTAATAVVEGWAEALGEFGEKLAAFSPFLPLPVGQEYTVTQQRATVTDIGDRSDAFSGSIGMSDPAGQSGTMPFASLTYQDGTRVYLLIAMSIPTESDSGMSTPVAIASDALVDRLAEVARGIEARSAGGAVTYSPVLGHCVGGMFNVLPAPSEMTDAEVIFEEQLTGPRAG
jgi:hypothetical protein